MLTFYAELNGGATVVRKADRMEIVDNAIRVWAGGELVGYFDLSVVLSAQLYPRGDKMNDMKKG